MHAVAVPILTRTQFGKRMLSRVDELPPSGETNPTIVRDRAGTLARSGRGGAVDRAPGSGLLSEALGDPGT